jgi:phosphonoacetate hydrolase
MGPWAALRRSNGERTADVVSRLLALDGIETAVTREEGCRRFELPPDRVGDVMVISTRNKALGTSRERHDLTGLKEPLRSHGGLSEQKVPLIVNRPAPSLTPDRRLRNFDIFDVVLNHTA